jgi:hypothetical protein
MGLPPFRRLLWFAIRDITGGIIFLARHWFIGTLVTEPHITFAPLSHNNLDQSGM